MTTTARTHHRQDAERRGRFAETVAAWYLRAKGYRILARRYRSPVGEIDLIARRGRQIAIVEVKARKLVDEAAASILPRQQRRIARAAEAFVASRPEYARDNIRFDAIFIAPWQLPVHIPAAWHIMSG